MKNITKLLVLRSCSSVGRALDSRSKGHRFNSFRLHIFHLYCLITPYKFICYTFFNKPNQLRFLNNINSFIFYKSYINLNLN